MSGRSKSLVRSAALLLCACLAWVAFAEEEKRWTDGDLVETYAELVARGNLDVAIRTPVMPSESAQPAFLEALAWFVAHTPEEGGVVTLHQTDAFIQDQVVVYAELLGAKALRRELNDYSRTRTWKVIQKLLMFREAMRQPPYNGSYRYRPLARSASQDDPWDFEHTFRSADDFVKRVCDRRSKRPILVKFGNTNCTQCMLFELIGSLRKYADRTAVASGVEVYKVWWGMKPDSSFAGRIRDPARLDDLAKAEGVQSSPSFIVYRDGRRYPCDSAFPDANGEDVRLDACLEQSKEGDGPLASVCDVNGSS